MMSLHEDEAVYRSLYTLPAIVLLAAVALSFLGLGFVMPLRALYAREIGASSVEVGLMATSYLLASFAVTPAIGWLSDHMGHRTVLGLSLLTYAGLLAAYVPVTSPGALIALRALEGVSAAGVLTPARALMNTVAPPDRYGEALGLVTTARTVGILTGPAVGTLLASSFGYTPSFLAASGVLTLTALAVFLFLRPHTEVTPQVVGQAPTFSSGFMGPLALAYGLAMVLTLPQGVTTAIWSLYMQDRGASLLLIGLSYTAFALTASALAPVAGRISDRYGRWRLMLAGLVLAGVVYCVYGLRLPPTVPDSKEWNKILRFSPIRLRCIHGW
jgi:MFS family permease